MNSETKKTFMHYSVPGLPAHESRMTDLGDAQEKAKALAVRTGQPVAIQAHYAEEGNESIEHQETVNP